MVLSLTKHDTVTAKLLHTGEVNILHFLTTHNTQTCVVCEDLKIFYLIWEYTCKCVR